jgi:hypothetical protein
MKRPDPHRIYIGPGSTPSTVHAVMHWGSFRRKHRRRYLAQRGRCYLCGKPLSLSAQPTNGAADPKRTTEEHIRPKKNGGRDQSWNIALAHTRCNHEKGSRHPHPCEILFGFVTADIVGSRRLRHDWRA